MAFMHADVGQDSSPDYDTVVAALFVYWIEDSPAALGGRSMAMGGLTDGNLCNIIDATDVH